VQRNRTTFVRSEHAPHRGFSVGITTISATPSGLRLLCPRCGQGRLFTGWFAISAACPHCGLDFKREPGFYLGSISINYGVTALGTGALYALLVFVFGTSHEAALTAW